MVKLFCDWCDAELELVISGSTHERYMIRYLPSTNYLSTSKWHIEEAAHWNNKLGADLCPTCYKVAVVERIKARETATKIMDSAVTAAKEAAKNLEQEARAKAKAQRVPRLENEEEGEKETY